MNLAFDFLASKLPIHGLAAYSIRSAGAAVASECFSKSLYPNSTGEMLAPADNVYFAGEHCSEMFQGFMNGGAETGRVAAENILAAVNARVLKTQ